MEFCELSYQIFVLLNLCCVSFVVGLALLLLSILVKTSFVVKFFTYNSLILVAFFLCIIIAVRLFEPLYNLFRTSRKLYSWWDKSAIRSGNCISTCICRFTGFGCFPSLCVRCCDTRPIYSLGHWAGLTRWMLTIWSCWTMKSCNYDYTQYLSFYKEVERNALIYMVTSSFQFKKSVFWGVRIEYNLDLRFSVKKQIWMIMADWLWGHRNIFREDTRGLC